MERGFMSHIGENWRSHVMLLLTLLSFTSATFAQSGKGFITGRVVDTAGAAVPGAQLQLTPLGITVVSNDEGGFRLPEVAPGKYVLTVSYIGFAPQTSDIELSAG
jgi:hypothetical protein